MLSHDVANIVYMIYFINKAPPPKKCTVSGNPTDPTFFGPYLIFFGTSENFSSIYRVFIMIFMFFLYENIFPTQKEVCLNLPNLKNIETIPEIGHFFFLPNETLKPFVLLASDQFWANTSFDHICFKMVLAAGHGFIFTSLEIPVHFGPNMQQIS